MALASAMQPDIEFFGGVRLDDGGLVLALLVPERLLLLDVVAGVGDLCAVLDRQLPGLAVAARFHGRPIALPFLTQRVRGAELHRAGVDRAERLGAAVLRELGAA